MMRYVMFLMAVLLVTGCGKRQEAEPQPADAPPVEESAAFDALFGQVRARYQEGDTDAAVEILVEALADPQFAAYHSTVFGALIELLLIDDRVIDAQTKYLAVLHASPDTAAKVFDMIPTHLKRKGDPAAYLSWTEQMVEADLPPNIAESAYAYYVDANVVAGNVDKLAGLVDAACTRFGGGAAPRIFGRPVNALVEAGEYDVVKGVLARMAATGDAAATRFVTGIEITLAAAQGQWASVETMFTTKAGELGDSGSKLALRTIVTRAKTAGQGVLVDRLCRQVLKNMPDATATRAVAVSAYLDVAVTAGSFENAVQRLQEVKTLGAGARLMGQEISKIFYKVMGKASEPSKQAMLDLLEWVTTEHPGQGQQGYQALLMDGAVLCKDYRRAMKVLKDGFRAADTEWHAMALNKVEAHLALQEGRTDDAVAMFRTFMKHVDTWTDATVDPTTGIAHTREMSLGFNAKRIGDIYRDAGRAEEAAAAYAEARGYFDTALAAAQADSKEHAYITGELAQIPMSASAPAP
jgi:tetratricopeptide (TPR) repeat protein